MRTSRLCLLLVLAGCGAEAQDRTPPAHVTVKPLFLVQGGRPDPTPAQRDRLANHLAIARERYQALLGQTFDVDTARAGMPIMRGVWTDAETVTGLLLNLFGVTRWTSPYVFVIVVMNAVDDPPGGGRPINGGFNTGGGIVLLSSYALDSIPFIQSTLQHELGHAFGLVHVDQYGRNMDTDSSMMSYNPAHHTSGYTASATPGTFSWEDRKALSLNQRVFPGLGYAGPVIPLLIGLNPMTITGHPAY